MFMEFEIIKMGDITGVHLFYYLTIYSLVVWCIIANWFRFE